MHHLLKGALYPFLSHFSSCHSKDVYSILTFHHESANRNEYLRDKSDTTRRAFVTAVLAIGSFFGGEICRLSAKQVSVNHNSSCRMATINSPAFSSSFFDISVYLSFASLCEVELKWDLCTVSQKAGESGCSPHFCSLLGTGALSSWEVFSGHWTMQAWGLARRRRHEDIFLLLLCNGSCIFSVLLHRSHLLSGPWSSPRAVFVHGQPSNCWPLWETESLMSPPSPFSLSSLVSFSLWHFPLPTGRLLPLEWRPKGSTK